MRYIAHHTIRLVRLVSVLLLPILAVGVLAPTIARADNTAVIVSNAAQAAMDACNSLSKVRTSGMPAAQTAAATRAATAVATQAATTQPPTPSATPRPAPTADRVGFPDGFQETFKLLFFF